MSQQEIDWVEEVMARGYILLRSRRGRYWPDLLRDHYVLVAVWGRPGFHEEEYEAVLRAVAMPPWELGLGVIYEDDEQKPEG